MAQVQLLALPAPNQADNINVLERDLMELRTKIAFLGDKNHALRAQLFHIRA